MEGYKNIDNISSQSIEQEYVISSQSKFFEDQKQRYQPKVEDFLNEPGYDPEEVQKEIDLSQKLKSRWEGSGDDFEKGNKKIADIFEGIIVDQFCGAWMANKAEAFFAADADDYLRKVDCVIEFAGEGDKGQLEYLGLGIDVTFSSDYMTLKNKLDSIWDEEIEKAKQVKIKYVDTENYKGSLDIFRAVLATNKETVLELARLYKNKERDKLDEHPYLANALFQIKYQLESYLNYAIKKPLPGPYLVEIVKTLKTFYTVYTEKEEFLLKHADDVQKTHSFQTIRSYCDDKLNSI
ncbi:MAG: hypothetical protein ABIO57_01030 [Candidatus Paceibacterota bacterium]